MRTLLAAVLLLLIPLTASLSQLRPFGDVHAIVGARIEIGDGRVIEKGDILIRDGLIEAVGTSLKIPPDAEILKGDGLVVFPGFIDAWMTKGLKPTAATADQDTPPDRSAEASPSMREANRKGVRADLHADEWLSLTDGDLTPIRKQGFTTALIVPTGGLINGYAALVNLSGKPKRNAVVQADSGMAMAVRIGGGNPFGDGGGYPGTILGYFSHLRQTLYDASYQSRLKSAFDQGGSHRPPSDSVLTSLKPLLNGRVRAFMETDTEQDAVRSLNLAKEFGLKPVLSGGKDAWKQSATIAGLKVPVILSLKLPDEPKTKKTEEAAKKPEEKKPEEKKPEDKKSDEKKPDDKPQPEEPKDDPDADVPEAAKVERHRLWGEDLSNAKKLNEAGVLLAFSSRGLKDLKEFWENLRKEIKDGLPREAAVKALALNPAKILGVDRQLGTVDAGKIANLTILTKDFVDPKAEFRYVFVDGIKFDLKQEPASSPRPGGNPFGDEEEGNPK